MSDRCQSGDCRKVNKLPWVVLTAAAIGVSAAAWVFVNKARTAQSPAQSEDLLDVCERAVQQLEARVSDGGMSVAI